MTNRFSVFSKSTFIILFACSAVPAFAQHGGGGHAGGGGFHGGGGSHSAGGGMRSSGGGGPRSSAPPAAGSAAPRSAAPSPLRSGGGFVSRPGTNAYRPGGNFAGGNQRFGNSVSAPPAVTDGRWHSFGGQTEGRGPSSAQSAAGPSSNAGNFRVFSGNRNAGSTGPVRSFSGQGGDVWENSPATRNVVPRSQSLSSIHNTLRGSLAANSKVASNSTLSASSRLAGESASLGNRQFSGSVGLRNSVQQPRGSRFGFQHNRFGRGCWNCGFGFGGWGGWGWGFGWGWPGFGFWGWDPFWVDPWWGWSAPGYGYPNNTVYAYPGSGSYVPDDNSTPPPPQDNQSDQYNQDSSNGNWVTPNGPSPSLAPNSANLAVPVLIYMKNGAVLTVRDYWMLDGELHYILMSGTQRSVNLELVDLPRTNMENAKSGVKFIFKSEPSATAPAQPDAEPGDPQEPAPTQQINAVPQPEAHT